MSIGSGNAETDDEFLFDCFVHYPPVERCLNTQSPGMIVAGRTGSGKTAILRYIERTVSTSVEVDPSEMSMSYVSNSDALRFLHAIGADLDLLFQVLWKHVLCIEFIRLRYQVDNEAKSRNVFDKLADRFRKEDRKKKAIKYLKEWEGKFWITMDENIKQITENVEKRLQSEFGAEIERFKAGGQYEKRLSSEKKTELVARSRSIINADQLSELHSVIELLSEESEKSFGKYYILVDKLDERWVDNSIRFRLIRSLMACLKSFRKIHDLKVLVALRSDILERVVQETQDLSFQREKFEDSYIRLKWSKSHLRELVDSRFRELFRRQYSNDNIGYSEIFPPKVGQVDSFDWMLERTLMRPRDIISFINECLYLAEGNFEVSVTNMRKAEAEYARKRRIALEQEWQSAFPSLNRVLSFIGSKKKISMSIEEMCDTAFDELAYSIATSKKVDHDPIFDLAEIHAEGRHSFSEFSSEVAAMLYRVGAVGIKVSRSDRFVYSHIDEPLISPNLVSQDTRIKIHPMLHGAFHLHASDVR